MNFFRLWNHSNFLDCFVPCNDVNNKIPPFLRDFISERLFLIIEGTFESIEIAHHRSIGIGFYPDTVFREFYESCSLRWFILLEHIPSGCEKCLDTCSHSCWNHISFRESFERFREGSICISFFALSSSCECFYIPTSNILTRDSSSIGSPMHMIKCRETSFSYWISTTPSKISRCHSVIEWNIVFIIGDCVRLSKKYLGLFPSSRATNIQFENINRILIPHTIFVFLGTKNFDFESLFVIIFSS